MTGFWTCLPSQPVSNKNEKNEILSIIHRIQGTACAPTMVDGAAIGTTHTGEPNLIEWEQNKCDSSHQIVGFFSALTVQ
jgi:hypothetical protein